MGKVIMSGIVPPLEYTAPIKGILLSDIAEGSIVKLNENNSPVEFYVTKHNYESALNGLGRTLLVRKNSYDKRPWNNTDVNNYATSTIDSFMNGSYKNLFDEKTKSAIGTTKLYYTPGNGNTTITTLERSIFLLSWYELGETMFCNNEGTPLSIASTLLNVSSPFWTRSPRISNTSDVAYKGKSVAGTTKATATTTSYGDLTCKPCFTLPSTAVFDETTMLLKGVA